MGGVEAGWLGRYAQNALHKRCRVPLLGDRNSSFNGYGCQSL